MSEHWNFEEGLTEDARKAIAMACARGAAERGVTADEVGRFYGDAEAAFSAACLWDLVIRHGLSEAWVRRVEGGPEDGEVIFGLGPPPPRP